MPLARTKARCAWGTRATGGRVASRHPAHPPAARGREGIRTHSHASLMRRHHPGERREPQQPTVLDGEKRGGS